MFYNVIYCALVIKKKEKLIAGELDEFTDLLIIPDGDFADISIKSVLFNIKKPKILSALDHPYVVGLLGGFASAIHRMNLYVFVLLCLSWMDDDHYVHIITRGQSSQPRHYFVL